MGAWNARDEPCPRTSLPQASTSSVGYLQVAIPFNPFPIGNEPEGLVGKPGRFEPCARRRKGHVPPCRRPWDVAVRTTVGEEEGWVEAGTSSSVVGTGLLQFRRGKDPR